MIIISAAALAAAIGTTDRAARRMIENLVRLTAIELLERNVAGAGRYRGQLRIYLRNPKAVPRSQPPGIRPDPQLTLVPDAIARETIPAHPAISAPSRHAIMAPKPPDAESSQPSQATAAQRFAVDRREIDSAIMAPKPPDPFNVVKEVENLSLSKNQGRFNALNNGSASPPGDPDEGLRVSGDIAAAIAAKCDPFKQKRRLEQEILAATGETDPTWWVAGNGADLVVNGGYPVAELQLLLQKVHVRRQLAPGAKGHIPNPQAYLQNALSNVARKRGVQWGRRRKSAVVSGGEEGHDQ